MNKICVLLILLSFLTFSNNAKANVPDFYQDDPVFLIDQERGLSLKFIGEREEGALEFFFKNDEAENQITDISSDRMNSISPAAGIQFRLFF